MPVALYRPDQVGELDRLAIESAGIDGYELMTRAGVSAYAALRERWPTARRVAVLCGGGNNGGDGYVIARLAAADGLDVRLMSLTDKGKLHGIAARAAADCMQTTAARDFRTSELGDVDVIVDAMLGTGLDRPVTGRFVEAIDAVNACGAGVLSVDIPSGLSGLTGNALGVAVKADLTPTFIGLKQGLFTADGPDQAGEVVFDDLAVPDSVYREIAAPVRRIDRYFVQAALPPRARATHKGRCGHVLVVGGAPGMGGAARMAAEAAARAGAGLVSVGTRAEHVNALLAACPELMVRAVEDAGGLEDLIERATVVALGPGLGRAHWGQELFARARGVAGPQVVDADGLNALADEPDRHAERVITPHPGEAARLLGANTAEIQGDRFTSAARLQARYGGVVVLKGTGTIVAAEGRQWLCDRGNPGMASGGMGDILTGIIAGLLAQGLSPETAAVAGVWIHASAADDAARDGERGLLATDVLARLRRVVNP